METSVVPFPILYRQFAWSTIFDRFDQFLRSYSDFWLIYVAGTSYKEVIPAEGVPIIVDALKDAKINEHAIQLMPIEVSEQAAKKYQNRYKALYTEVVIKNDIKKKLYDIL